MLYLRAELERERAVSERERERREKERKGWEDLESRVQKIEGHLTTTFRSAEELGGERGGGGGGGGGGSGGGGGEGVAVMLELTSRVVKLEEELTQLQQQQLLKVFPTALPQRYCCVIILCVKLCICAVKICSCKGMEQ